MQHELSRDVDSQYMGYAGAKSNLRLNTVDEKALDGRRIREEMVDLVAAPDDGIVLDIGCSDGKIDFDLISRGQFGGAVVGVDVDPSSLELNAKLRARVLGVTTLKLVNADMQHLPFNTNTFDTVISSFAFHHAVDPLAAVKEAVRVLKKPSGQLLVTATSVEHKKETHEKLAEFAELKGLTPRTPFSEVYNSGKALKSLTKYFTKIRVVPHVSEMRYYANEFDQYLYPTFTYATDFDPPIIDQAGRQELTAFLREAFDREVKDKGYFKESINLRLYDCRL